MRDSNRRVIRSISTEEKHANFGQQLDCLTVNNIKIKLAQKIYKPWKKKVAEEYIEKQYCHEDGNHEVTQCWYQRLDVWIAGVALFLLLTLSISDFFGIDTFQIRAFILSLPNRFG